MTATASIVRNATGGVGCRGVFLASGDREAASAAVALARKHGLEASLVDDATAGPAGAAAGSSSDAQAAAALAGRAAKILAGPPPPPAGEAAEGAGQQQLPGVKAADTVWVYHIPQRDSAGDDAQSADAAGPGPSAAAAEALATADAFFSELRTASAAEVRPSTHSSALRPKSLSSRGSLRS